MLISAIIREFEKFAHPSLQEKWDNTGLQVGSLAAECTGVLVCFDVTPAIIDEAIAKGCNLVLSHHPLFFRPVKRITGETPQQVCAINAIAAGITIYSSHTAADSARGGVSHTLARLIGVEPSRVLEPLTERLVQLSVITPASHAETVRDAIFDAGAGAIGDYDCCSFSVNGIGTFKAQPGANPYVGSIGRLHTENEVQINAVLPAHLVRRVEDALLETHPYETPAYTFTAMLNTLRDSGLGVYGITDEGLSPLQFVERVKTALGAKAVRTTTLPSDPDLKIRRVAVCGGAGGDLIPAAMAAGAQAYVSGDIRYHDFVDYDGRLLIIDAGHYETEAAIKQVFKELIENRFPRVKVVCTETDDNPVHIY